MMWTRFSARTGCTDPMLLIGQRHLQRALTEYIEHCNAGRAHRALNLRAPAGDPGIIPFPAHRIKRRPVLGGLINEYEAIA
jgi:putative transposase